MNLLKHNIFKVIEKRPLNAEEIAEFKTNEFLEKLIDDFIYVKWEAVCYGQHSIIEDYYLKKNWDIIAEHGYEMK